MNKAAPFIRLPPAGMRQRIGVFGGSFNPPHAGHRHVALMALRRLKLDQLWILVSPRNPLKDPHSLAPLAQRCAVLRDLLPHPRIRVLSIEAQLGSAYTCDTLRYFQKRRPDLRFIWVMGSDSLGVFHRWRHWRQLARTVPLAIVDRPGTRFAGLHSPAALAFAGHKRHNGTHDAAPALHMLHATLHPASSTALRQNDGLRPE